MENKKLTTEEIQRITELQQKNNALATELGQVELIKLNLQLRREAAEKFLEELRSEEQELGKELTDKYGSGSINLETGEFVPSPTQEEISTDTVSFE
jgi:hypothetical protein